MTTLTIEFIKTSELQNSVIRVVRLIVLQNSNISYWSIYKTLLKHSVLLQLTLLTNPLTFPSIEDVINFPKRFFVFLIAYYFILFYCLNWFWLDNFVRSVTNIVRLHQSCCHRDLSAMRLTLALVSSSVLSHCCFSILHKDLTVSNTSAEHFSILDGFFFTFNLFSFIPSVTSELNFWHCSCAVWHRPWSCFFARKVCQSKN